MYNNADRKRIPMGKPKRGGGGEGGSQSVTISNAGHFFFFFFFLCSFRFSFISFYTAS